MKAEIDENGNLYLQRANCIKVQSCPFDNPPTEIAVASCGDWCPQFSLEHTDKKVFINLCHGKEYIIDKQDFVDERINQKGE